MSRDNLQRALETEFGSYVKALFTCEQPYALTAGKEYTVLDVNALYRTSGLNPALSEQPVGTLCNVEFTVIDDRDIEQRVPICNFQV